MEYKKELPEGPSFKQQGLNGYNYNLKSEGISMTIEDCFRGHDKYCINTHSTHIGNFQK